MNPFITAAYAQEGDGVLATGFVVHWPFLLFALALTAFAVAIIWNNKEVSTGQIAILGGAIAIAIVPYIANFEFTESGFKFTTRDESAAITGQLTGLVKQNNDLRTNLKSTQEALLAVTERLKSLEARPSTGAGSNNNAPEFPPRPQVSLPSSAELRALIGENEAAVTANQQNLETLNRLEGQLAAPAGR